MNGKSLSSKEAEKFLMDHGFIFLRQNGSHRIFKNDEGQMVTITCKRLSQKTWQRELKKVGLE